MKTTISLSIMMICLAFGLAVPVSGQDKPQFVTVTTVHWNLDNKDLSMDDWKAVEKEYFDKVTMKNEYIAWSLVLNHYFTEDNTEIKLINGYTSWENIEKAQERSDELVKSAWPDEKARDAFFKKQSAYYTNMHSDEIYSTVEGAKLLPANPTKPMIYYVRISDRSFPEDGKTEEIQALRKEFKENVIDKNTYIKGYYPSKHAWGSDGRDFLECFVVESLGDLQLALDENKKLAADHWPDEKKRDEFFDKLNHYMTGFHADYIYRCVPELIK